MDNLKVRYGSFVQQAYATMCRRMWEADWKNRAAIRSWENCSWEEWERRRKNDGNP